MSCCIAFLFINPLQSLEFNCSFWESLGDLLLILFTELIIPQIQVFQCFQLIDRFCPVGIHVAIKQQHIALIKAFDKIVLGYIKLFSDNRKEDNFWSNGFHDTGKFLLTDMPAIMDVPAF